MNAKIKKIKDDWASYYHKRDTRLPHHFRRWLFDQSILAWSEAEMPRINRQIQNAIALYIEIYDNQQKEKEAKK